MAESLYVQIAEHIRDKIINGEFPIGSKLPTENELVQLFGASRPTIRQALDLLERENRLVRVKGSGTFVAQPKLVHESTSFLTSYREESNKNHRTVRTKVICLQTEKAYDHIASTLKLKPNELVTRLTRIRHLEHFNDDAPVVYTTVYIPHKLFPDMNTLDFTDSSLYEILDSKNLAIAYTSKKLEVMIPPADVAAGLGITAFEPCVFISSCGYTENGQIIEYSESYYPASRSSFRIETRR